MIQNRSPPSVTSLLYYVLHNIHVIALQTYADMEISEDRHIPQQASASHSSRGSSFIETATIHYITKAVKDANIGVSDMIDFLESIPEAGKVIPKVYY